MVLVTKTQKLVENSNLYRSYFKVVLLVVTHITVGRTGNGFTLRTIVHINTYVYQNPAPSLDSSRVAIFRVRALVCSNGFPQIHAAAPLRLRSTRGALISARPSAGAASA